MIILLFIWNLYLSFQSSFHVTKIQLAKLDQPKLRKDL